MMFQLTLLDCYGTTEKLVFHGELIFTIHGKQTALVATRIPLKRARLQI
jgi:hypothetical protein